MEIDEPDDTHHVVLPLQPQNADHHDGGALASAPGRTLLPGPVASVVSLATRSTSFALRVGTFIGGYGFGAAKFTTLSSLELGRGILEGMLSRAGRDVIARSRSELGRDDAETILEKSLESLHHTMTQIVFWTSAGFHVTETAVSSISDISQLFMSVLDQFFGSTDSSRAIASIITLIRREFQNPATGVQGERVGVVDLVLGLCGLAYLQNWCRRSIQEDARSLGHEEVIWDVVVLNDGARVDVHEDSLYGTRKGAYRQGTVTSNSDGVIEAIEQHGAQDNSSDDDLPELHLKRQIMGSLPKGASVSISTSTTSTKTITVEIKGAPTPDVGLLAPPGADVIESEITTPDQPSEMSDTTPTYRVVYRISRNRLRTTAMQGERDVTTSRVEAIEDEDDYDEELPFEPEPYEQAPPVPPKPARSSSIPTASNWGPESSNSSNSSNSNSSNSSNSKQRPGLSTGFVAADSPGLSRESSLRSPVLKTSAENAANQKKIRQPLNSPKQTDDVSPITSNSSNYIPRTHDKLDRATAEPPERKGGFRKALKKGSGSVTGLVNLLNKEPSSDNIPSKAKPAPKPPWGSYKPPPNRIVTGPARQSIPDRTSSVVPARDAPRPPQRGNPNFFSSRDLGVVDGDPDIGRAQSRLSCVAIQHRRGSSAVSQTDTFSVHSFESRPNSPTVYRSDYRSNKRPKSKSGNEIIDLLPSSTHKHHRPKSQLGLYSPSIYTLNTSGSQASLVLSSFPYKSAFGDSEAVETLRKSGMIDGIFPNFHILRNITRYSRYASAAYGSKFLKFMGIAKEMPILKALDNTHQDVRSFAHHTELPPDSILLSSFVDAQGGSDSSGSTDTGVPLVHTIAVDQQSKAVVLSCRGTLGFEDVLADMMCEYDDLVLRGKIYKVHKGIHASARRLLYGGDGRVLYTLKEALDEFPDYGVVLCGHSLGGAVTALLGAMLSEPATSGTAFITSSQQHQRLLTDGATSSRPNSPICLPAGRPIHVYAYGPPGTMSPSLQKATRGLITSIVHGNDLVPFLSLGVLHDFQALSLAFKTDNNESKAEVRRRIWEGLQSGLVDKWYNSAPKFTEEEDKWAYAALKTLRASMMSPKLLPPGEVFTIESTPALRRDAFLKMEEGQIGRPATRIVLKYIRDVEAHFREVKFGASMLIDHSPGRYEDALRRLTLGVVES